MMIIVQVKKYNMRTIIILFKEDNNNDDDKDDDGDNNNDILSFQNYSNKNTLIII